MVEITSIGFTDQYTGSAVTKNKFLMGAVGDVITATIGLSVHWESMGVICSFASATKKITRTDNRSFYNDGFQLGDTFDIVNSPTNDGSYTIAAISRDGTVITTVEALNDEVASGVDFHGTTPVSAFDFYFNLVPNGSQIDFTSLVDAGTVRRQTASKASWGNGDVVTFSASTISKAWVVSINDTIEKISTTDYAQIFTVTNIFLIDPLFLSGQVESFGDPLVYPPYFATGNCLKYICRADAKFAVNDPQVFHTTDPNYPFPFGNTGWFNEFLNGNTPEYSLGSLSYLDLVTSLAVTEPDFQNDTQVTMVINSASGNFTPYVAPDPGSQLILAFIYAPINQETYINTSTREVENFRLDRKLTTVGAASVNGGQYGTAYQALKDITVTYNSASQVVVVFTISLSQQTKTLLAAAAENDRHFLFWVTPQKTASTYLGDTDRNAVLGQLGNFAYNQDDTSLLAWRDTLFYAYPDTTSNGYTDIKGLIGDHYLADSKFIVNEAGTPKDATIEIFAYNSVTGESFVLESYNQPFPESELENGAVCDALVQPKVLQYQLSPTDPRNQAFLTRNVALDTPTGYGWEFKYGFVGRYETWRFVENFNSAFACDHSQNWSIYALKDNWSLKYRTVVNVEGSTGYITQFERWANVSFKDDSFSDDGFGNQIVPTLTTYRVTDSGYVDSKGVIMRDEDTHVKLSIAGDFSAFPTDATGYYAYLALDVYGTGGEFFRDLATSEAEPISSSRWMTRAFITVVSATQIDIEADIDHTRLDQNNEEYLITGRFGFKYQP